MLAASLSFSLCLSLSLLQAADKKAQKAHNSAPTKYIKAHTVQKTPNGAKQ